MGPCPSCGRWSSCVSIDDRSDEATLLVTDGWHAPPRIPCGLLEVDQVLGCNIDPATGLPDGRYGFAPDHVVLLGGDQGVGKTSLCLLVAHAYGQQGRASLFASGEQGKAALMTMAQRLRISSKHIHALGNEGNAWNIVALAEKLKVELLVVDSLNTAYDTDRKGEEGGDKEMVSVVNILGGFAVRRRVRVVILSHLNKMGEFRVPRSVEHLVDTVLYMTFDPDVKNDRVVVGTENHIELMVFGKNRHGDARARARFDRQATQFVPLKPRKASGPSWRPQLVPPSGPKGAA
jgi:DNA repair protein RadA/Sms